MLDSRKFVTTPDPFYSIGLLPFTELILHENYSKTIIHWNILILQQDFLPQTRNENHK